MIRAAALLPVTVALASCDVYRMTEVPARAVSVAEMRAHQRAWHGKTVEIRGWLAGCAGTTCTLVDDAPGALAAYTAASTAEDFDAMRKHSIDVGGRGHPLRVWQGQRVALRGTVDARCERLSHTWGGCVDGSDLTVTAVRALPDTPSLH